MGQLRLYCIFDKRLIKCANTTDSSTVGTKSNSIVNSHIKQVTPMNTDNK